MKHLSYTEQSQRPFLSLLGAGLILAALSGCAAPAVPSGAIPGGARPASSVQALCQAIGGQDSYSVTLAFGLSRPDGREITQAEWADFLARDVTPRFSAGLSVIDAQGQWQDAPQRPISRERARLVWIIAPRSAALAPALSAIRDAYKKRFNQRSVAAFIHHGCASF